MILSKQYVVLKENMIWHWMKKKSGKLVGAKISGKNLVGENFSHPPT